MVITHGTGCGGATTRSSTASTPRRGGTHQTALRAPSPRRSREFYHKDYDPSDIRTSIIAAISVKGSDPMFENQMKTKFGSKEVEPGVSVNKCRGRLPHQAPRRLLAQARRDGADSPAEDRREREGAQGDLGHQKKARETAKKVSLNNKKLRDCKIHRTDRNELAEQSMIFITEGNSASGSITKSRDAYAGGLLAARQAAELLRTDEEGGLRERGVQPPSGGAEHRGGHG